MHNATFLSFPQSPRFLSRSKLSFFCFLSKIVLSYCIPSEHPNSCQTPSDKTTHTIFSSHRYEENVVITKADSIIVLHCLALGGMGVWEKSRGVCVGTLLSSSVNGGGCCLLDEFIDSEAWFGIMVYQVFQL